MDSSILLFMPKLFYGGAETQFRYFIEKCNQSNKKIYVVIENKDDKTKEFIKSNPNVTFYEYNLSFMSYLKSKTIKFYLTRIEGMIKAYYQTRKIIKNHKDIKSALMYNGLGIKLIPLLKKNNIRVVFSERVDGKEITQRKINRKNLMKADVICSNSIPASRYLSELFGIEVPVIYNGVKVNENVVYKEASDFFYILVSARITPIKNIMGVVKAVNCLKNKENIRVSLCGKIGDQAYYEEIKTYIENNNLSDIIKYQGFVSNMSEYYKNSDLIVLASYAEGMPNAILESFANKRMIISSNIEMNTAIMSDKTYIFDPDNHEEIANKIDMVMRMDDAERKQVVDKNYRFVKENFDITKMYETYVDLLS